MGGFPSVSSATTLGRPKCARIKNSLPPWIGTKQNHNHSTYINMYILYSRISKTNLQCLPLLNNGYNMWPFNKHSCASALTGNDLMVQMAAFWSGAYLQLPFVVLNLGVSASAGTGMTISTLLAVERRLNWLFALIMYSTRLWAWRSITDSTQISGFTCYSTDSIYTSCNCNTSFTFLFASDSFTRSR